MIERAAAGTLSGEQSGSDAQHAVTPFVFHKSRLQRAAEALARKRSAAAFDRRSPFDRRSSPSGLD